MLSPLSSRRRLCRTSKSQCEVDHDAIELRDFGLQVQPGFTTVGRTASRLSIICSAT